jgi:ELWxxDGT repeat protein
MKKLLLTLCAGGLFYFGQSQQFTLLKDINPGTASSNICYLTNVDNVMFFAATNGVNGMELWKTDGTDAGTVMVKDIRPGASNSSIGYLTSVNHVLYFVANNGVNGTELWKSDGTAAGTVMVKDIRSGSLSSNPSGLINFNGLLYFSADNGINGTELWKSDGTAAGTVMVKDINPFSSGSYPQALASVNGVLFFAADNGVDGMELWKSDGSASGTTLVKDIWAGPDGSYPYGITGIGSSVFFAASDGVVGTELWKSDGSTAGTSMLKDIWTGSSDSYPFSFKNVGDQLFFSADNGSKGDELWKSDGTAAGTTMVKDIWPGVPSGAAGNFSSLLSRLLFTGNDGVSGYTTWQSDGTAAGTKVASIGSAGDMQELVETADNIYASIRQNDLGRELWSISFGSILPVTMLDFKARLAGNDAILDWRTEQELNADNFVIEKSTDGVNYSVIGSQPCSNTPGVHDYRFTDIDATSSPTGVIYYRLRQFDNDGHYSFSKVVTLTVGGKAQFSVYPNPASSALKISVNVERRERLTWTIYDNGGRLVRHESLQAFAGNNQFEINIASIPSGVYYIRLQGGNIQEQRKYVKR